MLKPGQPVLVNTNVRPRRFAGKRGTVVEVGEEIGVRLGSARSHSPLVWFTPQELSTVEVGQSASMARHSPVRGRRDALAPPAAEQAQKGDAA